MSTPVHLQLPLPATRATDARRAPQPRSVRVHTSTTARRAPAGRPARVGDRWPLWKSLSDGWPGDVEGWLASLDGTLEAQGGAALNIPRRYAGALEGLNIGPASALWKLVGELRAWVGSLAGVTP